MSKEATNENTEMELLSEQELDAVTGGGRSHCEGDDGSSSGGSTPKPKPPRNLNNNVQDNYIQTSPSLQ